MSADIVAPVGVADVRGGSGEPRLKGQRLPNGDRVAGEADLVTMITKASPAME